MHKEITRQLQFAEQYATQLDFSAARSALLTANDYYGHLQTQLSKDRENKIWREDQLKQARAVVTGHTSTST